MLYNAVANDTAEKLAEEARQILTFLLDGHSYGIDLVKVKEIRGFTQITPIPNMPVHIKGVMNLRGAVLPVVDLRMKFGMQSVEYSKFTVIIIVQAYAKTIGLIVDAVSNVVSTLNSKMQPPPDFGQEGASRCVLGILKMSEGFVVVLDLERLLIESDLLPPLADQQNHSDFSISA